MNTYNRYIACVTGVLLLMVSSFRPAAVTSVTLHITNLRSEKGMVLVALYNRADIFPKDASKYALIRKKVAISNKTATVVLPDLPDGRYAIAILHDENSNLKMDFNFVGMPREGYGFSNNAKGRFGPPGFDKAAFDVKGGSQTIGIKMQYFL